ncbi:sigma-54 interaction domain-containing protein [Paenibacillus montanisoli]|uniref:Sigma-54-dependent Fis family transcriptional regulator n=1 Tax=Paenibacillus montanisoli TaxID=2081970 RepID=A0A328U738_9BACL|nr:sigma 54-interacting transcriptional regulator [Paenibacillus montanisoli]RAP78340.1 sigma-54-dependent Fis family transcriptional regulator [Paenibacillus montanisoli]
MFNIEHISINNQITHMDKSISVEQLKRALREGEAVMFADSNDHDKNSAVFVVPGDLPLIEVCCPAAEASAMAGICEMSWFRSPVFDLTAANLLTTLNSRTNRPVLLRDPNGKIIGYAGLAELLRHAIVEQQRWEAYFKTLSETVTEAVTVVDRSGEVICWNPVAEEIYNLPKSDILGRRIGEHFETETLMVLKILDEGRLIRNTYHRPREDTHVLINASPIRGADGAIIGGIAAEQDITQLVRLNEQLTSAHTLSHLHRSADKELFSLIKGKGPAIGKVMQWARKVAATDTPVLLIGEGGVGKEQLAQIIHNAGPRAEHAFLSVNCGIVPMGLLETELFGFQGGAFTGTESGQAGKLEQAKDGTLFINEIDRMSLELQAKLYHYISQQTFTRSGGSKSIEVRTRIIAASTQDLASQVAQGLFRSDLYYALNVVSLVIPPLRERPEDIPAMLHMYLKQFSLQYQKPLPALAPEVLLAFSNYDWPGNILELRNVIERCVILSDEDTITLEHLPPALQAQQPSLSHPAAKESDLAAEAAGTEKRLKASISNDEEQALIHDALARTAGNKSAAAKLLGVSRGTLYNKMKEFGLE